jgi:predicted membrane channel-forming protein YqfA (hemolysin III family)
VDDSPIPERWYIKSYLKPFFNVITTQIYTTKRHPAIRAVFLFSSIMCCFFSCLFHVLNNLQEDFKQVFWGGNNFV